MALVNGANGFWFFLGLGGYVSLYQPQNLVSKYCGGRGEGA